MKHLSNIEELKSFNIHDLNKGALWAPFFNNTEWKLRQYATEGYRRNVIAYRCIEEIVRAATDVNIAPMMDGKELEEGSNDDLRRLYDSPAPMVSFSDFLGALLKSYLWSGSGFILGVDGVFNPSTNRYDQDTSVPTGKKLPAQLIVLKPYEVEVKTYTGNDYKVEAFVHRPDNNAIERRYPVDAITNLSRIAHIHTYNPHAPCLGMSPLEAAQYNIDIHNEGSRWNISLLKNSCAPSGIITTEQSLPQGALSSLITQIKAFFSGSRNAGRTMVLDNGAKYQQLGLSPKDMDFISSLDTAARNIASAYGVPFALILPESSTYNNQHDARVSLYENTVLPLLSDVLDGLALWLSTISGKNYSFHIDRDSISALEEKRQIRFDRMAAMVQSGILTPNEAREELGYEELPEMDEQPGPDPVQPTDSEEESMKRLQAIYEKCRTL